MRYNIWPQQEVSVRVAGRKLSVQEPQWRCAVLGVLLFLIHWSDFKKWQESV